MLKRNLLMIFCVVGASGRLGVCQMLTTVRVFDEPAKGTYAYGRLLLRNGDLIGAASTGGMTTIQCQNGCGTVFKLAPSVLYKEWTETVLHTFAGGPDDGYNPMAGLTNGPKGVLYGTTLNGGNNTTCNCGIVFQLTPPNILGSWTETVLHSFSGPDGANPEGVLAIDGKGHLYGTTVDGGAANAGTVFKLTPPSAPGGNWGFTTLYSFGAFPGDGMNPFAGVTIGKGGVLYGTTQSGGGYGEGSVFELSPPAVPGGPWTETVLYSFLYFSPIFPDGTNPYGGVIVDASGVLYGTTYAEGTSACLCGTVFKLEPPAVAGQPWAFTKIYQPTQFGSGSYRSNLVFGPNGSLYGASGTGVFQLTPPAGGVGAWNLNFSLPLRNEDTGGLVLDTSGALYGAATSYAFKLVP